MTFNAKTLLNGAVAAALAITTLTSQAAPTFFANRAGFLATLNSSVTDDYSNPGYVFINSDAAMSAVLGETDYRSTGFSNLNIVNGAAYCAGCNGSFELSFTTTSVGDANGVFGVGLDVKANTGYHAYITFGDNSMQDVLVAGSFFGLTATEEIKSIHFGLANGGTTTGGSFLIDNLTIGSQGSRVPEPASLALVGTALLGVFGASRRRAK